MRSFTSSFFPPSLQFSRFLICRDGSLRVHSSSAARGRADEFHIPQKFTNSLVEKTLDKNEVIAYKRWWNLFQYFISEVIYHETVTNTKKLEDSDGGRRT